jgi:hypothetical protein
MAAFPLSMRWFRASESATRHNTRSGPVFICYRRDDTSENAGRLYDNLVHAFGKEAVFFDIDSIPLGVDFIQYINTQISGCSAVIVMIGRNWLKAKDHAGRRRLDDPNDHVRIEIETALAQNIPVIPVLVQGASMPREHALPSEIRSLVRRNGIDLSDTRWKGGVERLVKELEILLAD